jgi:ATP-dependent RNA helicase DDX3X
MFTESVCIVHNIWCLVILLSFRPTRLLILTGRTARIGNEGLASSFYNDRNEELAIDLVKILIECKQHVPDFLEGYRPEGDVLEFDDDSDNEEEASSQIPDEDATEVVVDEDAADSAQPNWNSTESDDIWN